MSLYQKVLDLLASSPQYQKDITLGKRIGFYRIGKELGSGNFSKVKFAIHVLTKEKVAIKIMEKTKMDQKSQRLLAREIENMDKTHHPNVIRLFEVVENLSRLYLVMEFADGGELYHKVVEKGRMTEEQSKPVYAQVLSAIKHLHDKDIIHRDIKAENVFFGYGGKVKLGDLGFSTHVEPDTTLNTFCGSPPYAAPELFRDKRYVGKFVDIWALGILVYFMVTGNTPFRGDTVADLKRMILEGEYYLPEFLSLNIQDLIKEKSYS